MPPTPKNFEALVDFLCNLASKESVGRRCLPQPPSRLCQAEICLLESGDESLPLRLARAAPKGAPITKITKSKRSEKKEKTEFRISISFLPPDPLLTAIIGPLRERHYFTINIFEVSSFAAQSLRGSCVTHDNTIATAAGLGTDVADFPMRKPPLYPFLTTHLYLKHNA